MSLPRTRTATDTARARPDRPFFGYDQHGHLFRSSEPIHSSVGNLLDDLRRRVRAQYLSPADVAMILSTQPAKVRSAFPSAPLWAGLPYPWQWGGAGCSTSAEADVKHNGPPDPTDENANALWLEAAERHHNHPCRFSGLEPGRRLDFLGAILTIPETLELRRATHPAP